MNELNVKPIFSFTAIPPPSESTPELEATFEKLKAVGEGERSVKFLLTNELLHKFNLLDSSLSIIAHLPPLASGLETETQQASVPATEPTSSESHEETVLKKCSSSAEDTGPSEKVPLSPIGEEEETIPKRPGKELAGSDERTEEETTVVEGERNVQGGDTEGQHTEHESDDAHIFSNLGDFMGSPSDLYISQATLSGLGLSPSILISPPAKDVSLTTRAPIIQPSHSGLWCYTLNLTPDTHL